MLRIIVNASAAGAKSYYSSGLSREDYYAKGKSQEIIGEWGGKGAERLGLNGTVDREQFASLCDNVNPETGKQLTGRNNENRRVGYDLNFHAPKSVSICYSLNADEKIMSAFRESVRDTMSEIEKDMQARVRIAGQNENRDTGNIVYGEFIHTTARPVDGVPDPHLHAHCFTFNATFDEVEGKWKAGEFGNIKKDAAYFEAYFHSGFSNRLAEMGYEIEKTEKGWELAGVGRETIEKFSNRTIEVEEIAKEKGITDAKAKDQLGAKTRNRKAEDLSIEDLKTTWERRLSEQEKGVIGQIGKGKANERDTGLEADKALNLSLDHCLERKSVVGERELLRDAMKRSYGLCSPQQVNKQFEKKEKDLIKAHTIDGHVLTTKEAVKEERKLVEMVVADKGKLTPINKVYEIQNQNLNHEQRNAVQQAMHSKDRVIVIEGGAGTGKTTLMKEIALGCEAGKKPIFAFAPSAEASRGVLKDEGFLQADTVSRLLADKEMQTKLKGNVLWIDEAGLLGNKQMNQVLELTQRQDARLILTGDAKQHTSVERGDALRIIMEKSKVQPSRVTEIQRQKGRADYKEAVKLISEGKHEAAFSKLEHMGAIQEITDHKERHGALAREYTADIRSNKSVLVVAPTHIEGESVTNQIRNELKKSKAANGKPLLEAEEKGFTIQKNLSFTEVQKQEPSVYRTGMSIQFHQNAKGFARGGIYDVTGRDNQGNIIVKNQKGESSHLPLSEGKKFSVFEKVEIGVSQGDRIRITQNGFSMNDKRMNNGNLLTVQGFDKSGNIIARAEKGTSQIVVGKNYRNFTYGYCTTSHSSQGKTVDKVLIAQSSFSARAASREQFYVSVSRGKTGISIYTDNKMELKDAVAKTSQRMTAIELQEKANTRPKVQRPEPFYQNLGNRQRQVSRLATLNRIHYDRAIVISQNIRGGFSKR